MNDLDPAYGPYDQSEPNKQLQIPQRYATLMLALAGIDATKVTNETEGVAQDLGAVATSDKFAMILGPLVVILGPIAYLFCGRRKAATI